MKTKQSDARSTRSRCVWLKLVAALGAAMWAHCAVAEGVPGAKPGDEALSCDQIYAEGMAETQREQQARDQKAQALKLQEKGLIGAIGATMATANPVAGQAANAQALGLAESTNRLGRVNTTGAHEGYEATLR